MKGQPRTQGHAARSASLWGRTIPCDGGPTLGSSYIRGSETSFFLRSETPGGVPPVPLVPTEGGGKKLGSFSGGKNCPYSLGPPGPLSPPPPRGRYHSWVGPGRTPPPDLKKEPGEKKKIEYLSGTTSSPGSSFVFRIKGIDRPATTPPRLSPPPTASNGLRRSLKTNHGTCWADLRSGF